MYRDFHKIASDGTKCLEKGIKWLKIPEEHAELGLY